MSSKKNRSARFPALLVLLVIAAAFLMRMNALWVPHWRGDQAQYAILAMKLTNFGLDGYNLRRAVMGVVDAPMGKDRRIEFAALKPDPDPNAKGMYLAMMDNFGQSYYDEPLHMRAPLFPAVLAVSHRLLSGGEGSFMVLTHGFRLTDPLIQLRGVWSKQLWAVIVPLFFDLALIALTALLAWRIFRCRRTAVLAAALLATNPLSLFLAHRVLTEDMATFWVTALMAALWTWHGRMRSGSSGWLAAAAAGLFAGLAVLTNQRAGLGVVAAGLTAVIWVWQKSASTGFTAADTPSHPAKHTDRAGTIARRIAVLIRAPFFWVFAATFAAATAFWFLRVFQTYGDPLHQPHAGMAQANQEDMTGWFAAVAARPHTSVMFALGVPLMCPLFAAAFGAWPRFWSALRGAVSDDASRGTLMLWVWVLAFYVYLVYPADIFATGNKEHRYFYFAYPAIAILAASVLRGMRQWALLPLLILNTAWGCWQAYPKIFTDQLLF
jgi:4-amino-4-deoxy-L-arabinose transferase-like glycosyltransferase